MTVRYDQWVNPFKDFLEAAQSEFRRISPAPEVRGDASLLPRFVEISERRNFVFDIVFRVQTIAAAFDRLRKLSKLYARAERQIDAHKAAQRDENAERVQFEVPDRLHDKLCECHDEAQALVAYVYYELSTLVTLLRGWLSPLPGSHLEYLVGVRNKILTHPSRDGRIKNSRSELTLGPILHAHLVGASSWVPLIKQWYLKELSGSDNPLDDDAGAELNVGLIRDPTKKVEDFTVEEKLRLKAYRIPEPNPLGSARDMATLLHAKFLPQIQRACRLRLS